MKLASIMNKLRIITLVTVIIFTSKLCNAEEINEDWIHKDSIFINQVKNSFLTDPLTIEKYLEPWENSRVDLGFGYSLIEHSMGKGYVSIFYTFIYKNKKLISFILRPQMPNNSRLTKRYLSFYKGLFEIEDQQVQNLCFGYKNVAIPLGEPGNDLTVSSQMEYFMTPYSGVIYGDYGGIANEMLENRNLFNTVKDSITEDLLIYLLKSLNPATRMYAAELFYSNEDRFNQKELIERLIELNFKELPEITTMSGCIILVVDSKKILKLMLK
jgi:hypothetical protein